MTNQAKKELFANVVYAQHVVSTFIQKSIVATPRSCKEGLALNLRISSKKIIALRSDSRDN